MSCGALQDDIALQAARFREFGSSHAMATTGGRRSRGSRSIAACAGSPIPQTQCVRRWRDRVRNVAQALEMLHDDVERFDMAIADSSAEATSLRGSMMSTTGDMSSAPRACGPSEVPRDS
jgi:hypothetical protein